MKLLLSDTHLGLKNASDFWLEVTLNLFREVRDFCLTRNIDTVIHLGDWFDEKKTTNQKVLDYAYRIVSLMEPLKILIITGNHDIYYKESISPSSLACFRNIPNVEVITEPTTVEDNLILVPWKQNPPKHSGFCFGHFEITDFSMNNTSVCRNGQNASDFKHFKHVYSGHFHTPSSRDNITYIGSAFQQTFNDVGSSRGYYAWENGDMEFVEYKDAPKFVKVHTSTDIQESDITGNIVKLIYDEDYGTNKNTKILESVESMNPVKLLPDFTNVSVEEDQQTLNDEGSFTLLDHDDIIREYIESDKSMPKNINRKVLLKMIYNMKGEAGI
jgi:DNA repair exonuclease SbcCD nuclease subunit